MDENIMFIADGDIENNLTKSGHKLFSINNILAHSSNCSIEGEYPTGHKRLHIDLTGDKKIQIDLDSDLMYFKSASQYSSDLLKFNSDEEAILYFKLNYSI